MRPSVLITNPLSKTAIDYLRRFARVSLDYHLDERGLLRKAKHYDAIVVRSSTRVRSCVLSDGRRGRLRVVGTATAGWNHINVETARKVNVQVIYSPWGNTLANAEFIIGSMVALSRSLIRSDRLLRMGVWNQEVGIGPELYGKIFGTIGFGKIGSLAAQKALALGMKVVAYDPWRTEYEFVAKGVRPVRLETLLRVSDFVSLSLPLNNETVDLLGARELRLMKPTAYLIQSSRGGVVDEEALIVALARKKIAGAAVDVFLDEPLINPRFRRLENVILTPHIGCSSVESRIRSGLTVARGVLNALRRKPVSNIVPTN